jgi:hypothetical protein
LRQQAQKEPKAGDDEAKRHYGKTRAQPRKQRALCGKENAWVGLGHLAWNKISDMQLTSAKQPQPRLRGSDIRSAWRISPKFAPPAPAHYDAPPESCRQPECCVHSQRSGSFCLERTQHHVYARLVARTLSLKTTPAH